MKNMTKVARSMQAVVYLIDKRGGAESFILAGTIAPPRNSPQEIALGIWNDILGGTFGGRVNMNLREDKHWSYGARTAFQFARGDSAWLTQAPVQTDNTKQSLISINKHFPHQFTSLPLSHA